MKIDFCKHDQESKPDPDLLGKIPDPDAPKNVRIRNSGVSTVFR
jgi:hypothetical protein